MEILTNWFEPIISALLGGGLVMLFTLPEKKRAAKLENDAKVINEYAELLTKYKSELDESYNRIDALQKRIEELEAKSISEKQTRDNRIAELEQQVRELEEKLYEVEAHAKPARGANGRFTKKEK